MKRKKRTPRRTDPAKRNVARILFFVNALVWVGFSVYVVLDMANNFNEISAAVFVGIFMLVNAGLMLWCGIMLAQPQKWGYYFALVFLFLNILYTLSVQFGLLDIITFVLDVIILIVLISFQKEFLS
jgi:uncharacterized membrane protein